MRNDHEGRIRYESISTFYASGEGGDEPRANGDGGFMERGYYSHADGGEAVGPYSTRNAAWRAAGVEPTTAMFYARSGHQS